MGLLFASGVSLAVISLLVFLVVGGLLWGIDAGEGSMLTALGITIGFNILLWLIGPYFQDFFQRQFYKVSRISLEEFRALSPKSAAIIESLSLKHGFALPKIGLIDDGNPTAYTYGSGPWNGRIILSKGLLNCCSDEEVAAVMAHEVGHIVHWDIAIMTGASLMLQVIYFVYIVLRRAGKTISRNTKKGPPLHFIALLVYVVYLVGRFVLLYLSRVREYYADKFAAEHTNGNDLSSALVAISYGLVAGNYEGSHYESIQHLGVVNMSQAVKLVDSATAGGKEVSGGYDWPMIEKVIQYDIYNPWAGLSELFSTHPLTGKRIKAMMRHTVAPVINFSSQILTNIDRGKMRRMFWGDIAALVLPVVAGWYVLFAWVIPTFKGRFDIDSLVLGGLVSLLGIFMFAKAWRKYGGIRGYEPTVSTMAELATNPYASPFKGTYVALEGKIIGKGTPGYMFSEDMKLQDKTGLLYVDYHGLLGLISNFFMAVTKIKKLIGKNVRVTGWFLRYGSYRLIADNVKDERGNTVRSFGRMRAYVVPMIIIAGGVIFMFLSF